MGLRQRSGSGPGPHLIRNRGNRGSKNNINCNLTLIGSFLSCLPSFLVQVPHHQNTSGVGVSLAPSHIFIELCDGGGGVTHTIKLEIYNFSGHHCNLLFLGF